MGRYSAGEQHKDLNLFFFFLILQLISWAPYTVLHCWLENEAEIRGRAAILLLPWGISSPCYLVLGKHHRRRKREKARVWLSGAAAAGYLSENPLSLRRNSLTCVTQGMVSSRWWVSTSLSQNPDSEDLAPSHKEREGWCLATSFHLYPPGQRREAKETQEIKRT